MYQWIIHLVLLIVICFFYYKSIKQTHLSRYFIPALCLKLLAGIILGIIYSKLYNRVGDTFVFYEYSQKYSVLLASDPQAFIKFVLFNECDDSFLSSQPRVMAFIKISSLITFISFNNYWIASLYFSLLSFFGFYFFANKVATRFPQYKWEIVIPFLYFPSVVFWSSGFIKESIVMPAMMIILSLFFDWVYEKKRPNLFRALVVAVLACLVFFIKFYYAAVLIPVLLATWLTEYLSEKRSIRLSLQVAIFIGVLLGLFIFASFLNPYLSINSFLQSVYQNYLATLDLSSDDKIIHFNKLSPSLSSFFINIPLALFSGLFRPLFFDSKNILMFLASVENLVVFGLTILALINYKRVKADFNTVVITAVLIYVFMLASLLAFASPNLGTLARYKVGFTPFWICLLLLLFPKEKVQQKFKRLFR